MKIAFSGLLVFFLAAALFEGSDEHIQELLRKYSDIKHAEDYRKFYESLFAACQQTELEVLLTDRNDSIATQSAWEIVNRTVPVEQDRTVDRPDSQRLAWFLGFFEGRNRIVVPEWWREAVSDARANRRGNIYPGNPKTPPYHPSGIAGISCPIDASIEEQRKAVTYRRGDDSIVVPEELVDRANCGTLCCNICCSFTAEHAFVATHLNFGWSHNVACIDRKTNRIIWKSEACGCWWGDGTGQHESSLSILPTSDGRVFVFGTASIGFYAHGFNAADGKTLVRFANNY